MLIKSILLVGSGGFIGSVLRFLVARYIQQQASSAFPWGTFAVNIIGSLIIGIVYGLSDKTALVSSETRLFLAVGFCGGFTTFSSFANDALLLLQGRELFSFALYMSVSFFAGLIMVFAGRLLVNQIF